MVGGAIVDDDNLGLGHQGLEFGDEIAEALCFILGGYDYGDSAGMVHIGSQSYFGLFADKADVKHSDIYNTWFTVCRVGKRLLRNPPSVAQQHNALFKECLTARLVGYGTNSVPYPPYISLRRLCGII